MEALDIRGLFLCAIKFVILKANLVNLRAKLVIFEANLVKTEVNLVIRQILFYISRAEFLNWHHVFKISLKEFYTSTR